MATPTSKATFSDWCLRKLGYPVIEINVAAEQIDDRIDEALQMFQTFHMDAVERVFMSHTITQDDIDNGWIPVDEPVLSVLSVIWLGSSFDSANFGTAIWQVKYDVYSSLGFGSSVCGDSSSSGGLADYVVRMQNLSSVDYMLANKPRIQHSAHSNKLFIETDWSAFSVGDIVVMEAYIGIDPDTYTDIWNDIWLKKYATALIGEQWGLNLEKFENVELPGGITLNGTEIANKYRERIISLEEELEDKYQYPPDFLVG